MRIDVKKYIFLGTKAERETFFKEAQNVGVIEFIDLTPQQHHDVPHDLQILRRAHKILLGEPVKEQKELPNVSDVFSKSDQVVSLKNELEGLFEEKRTLNHEITRVEPFGDFNLDDLEYIEKEGNRNIQFFFTTKKHEIEAPNKKEVLFISASKGMDYFIAINKSPQSYKGMVTDKGNGKNPQGGK